MGDCDFRWTDIRHPGVTSNNIAFSTSELGCTLEQEESNISLQGNTPIGDNVWFETHWMATPIFSNCASYLDESNNFYHLQMCIKIEQAFGILVHFWGILCWSLSYSILN